MIGATPPSLEARGTPHSADLPGGPVDVLIAGAGNAAMCAAIEAARRGRRVVVVDVAPEHMRGGNTRHTRNMRLAHHEANSVFSGPYPPDELLEDLQAVVGNDSNDSLTRLLVEESVDVFDWLTELGVRFQPSLEGTLSLGRTNAFFLGGGRAMLNALHRTAASLGVHVLYHTEVVDVEVDPHTGECRSVTLETESRQHRVAVGAFIAAAGGFESNLDWLEESWGPPARNFIVRGTPFNRGRVLQILRERGVALIGDPKQCHAVAIDGRAPKFDGGIVTRLDCVPFGIVLNANGERFYDEGEDFWPKRYAIWGRMVAMQPDQVAHVIIDSTSIDLFMPSVFPPEQAQSLEELSEAIGLNPTVLTTTVAEYNNACVPGTFDSTVHDDCRTEGIEPAKSHWARPITEPPFYAYTLRCGITFTYLALKVDHQARVIMANEVTSPNIFAAGEIMAGNILDRGYLAGLGMTIGSVFGRLAGSGAADV